MDLSHGDGSELMVNAGLLENAVRGVSRVYASGHRK